MDTRLTDLGEQVKARLLYEASKKNPVRLMQIDGFYVGDSGDGMLCADEKGIALTGGKSVELFNGSWDARVFFNPSMDRALVAHFLRRAAEWIENGGLKEIEGPFLGQSGSFSALYDYEGLIEKRKSRQFPWQGGVAEVNDEIKLVLRPAELVP